MMQQFKNSTLVKTIQKFLSKAIGATSNNARLYDNDENTFLFI
jgi:hypothetical protein